MYLPFSDQYGSIIITDEQFDEWETFGKGLRFQEFKRLILDAISPYELWGLIFNHMGRNLEFLFPNFKELILRLIAENTKRWDLDEVICFLLEAATNHHELDELAIQCLWDLKTDNIVLMEHSNAMLSEFLLEDVDVHVITALYQEKKWQKPIQKLLVRIADEQFPQYKEIYLNAAVKILSARIKVNAHQLAAVLIEGYQLLDQRQYSEAIKSFSKFYSSCPGVLSDQVSVEVARSLSELEWKGEALSWVTTALNHNPDFRLAQNLQQEISAPYRSDLEKIKSKFVQPHWVAECTDIFATTELLFRIHGRIMDDYGSIINGYGRSVEVQLNKGLLPKIQDWIKKHGNCEEGTGRFFISAPGRKIYSDENQSNLSLGAWAFLLDDDKAYTKVDDKGTFFYCAARFNNGIWGYYEWSQKLTAYGRLIRSFSELRNEGSHDSSSEWNNVVKTRELCLQILEGIPLKEGNLVG